MITKGLVDLRTHADAAAGDEFFRALAGLLQERLGERLDLPASGITESVIAERLAPAGIAHELCGELEHLFDAINRARYAPSDDSGELKRLADMAEATLTRLREVEIA